jgi:hypothetical protein
MVIALASPDAIKWSTYQLLTLRGMYTVKIYITMAI